MWTLPATRSVIAGAAPLYGMCVMLMPAADLNISIVRCEALPTATEAYENRFGSALAFATRSATLLMPAPGCTVRYWGEVTASVIGARSFTESYGILSNKVGLIASGPL